MAKSGATKTQSIMIRLAEDEKKLIEDTAARLGITRTELILRGIQIIAGEENYLKAASTNHALKTGIKKIILELQKLGGVIDSG